MEHLVLTGTVLSRKQFAAIAFRALLRHRVCEFHSASEYCLGLQPMLVLRTIACESIVASHFAWNWDCSTLRYGLLCALCSSVNFDYSATVQLLILRALFIGLLIATTAKSTGHCRECAVRATLGSRRRERAQGG